MVIWGWGWRMNNLDRERIVSALEELSRRLGKRGVRGEVCIFGGSAMILAFQSRQSTRDIDAVFAPAAIVRQIAEEIGRENGYADGWFNDGVKGFVSERHATTSSGLPQFEYLQVTMPVPEYLFAMKCMASRVGLEGGQDEADARFLIKLIGLAGKDDAMRLVEAYYPANHVPPRVQYFIESLFEQNDLIP